MISKGGQGKEEIGKFADYLVQMLTPFKIQAQKFPLQIMAPIKKNTKLTLLQLYLTAAFL